MTKEEKDKLYRKVIFKKNEFDKEYKKGWLHQYGMCPQSLNSNNSQIVSAAIIEEENGLSHILKIGEFIFVD